MSKYLRPLLAGVLGGIVLFVGASLISGVLPNVENNPLMFGLGSLLFVLIEVIQAAEFPRPITQDSVK
jgi:hypothetical protein